MGRATAYSSFCSQVLRSLGLYQSISSQFTFKLYAAAKNRKKH